MNDFVLATAGRDRRTFWKWGGANGDFKASIGEWSIAHNRRRAPALPPRKGLRAIARRVFASRAGREVAMNRRHQASLG